MIDHILLYASDTARDTAWPAPVDEDGDPLNLPCWADGTRNAMPTRVVMVRGTYDEEGEELTAEVTAPGSWLVIRTASRDPELEAMDEAVIVTDADLMAAAQPYVIKCTLLPETLLGQVDPVWAGGAYSIPVGQPASVLDDWRIAA